MNDSLQINFDPMFIEEAVFLLLRTEQGDKLYRDFCGEKDRIYQQDVSGDERDQPFKLLYEKWFRKLGLEDFFRNICKDFPLFSQQGVRVVVKRVWNKKHEEAELYVQPHQKTVYLGILVRRMTDLIFLEAFLRHELTRIADMLSLDFRYSPHPALGGKNEIENNLIRDRFRLLWDLYIDARLVRKGFKVVKPYEKLIEEFGKKFFFLAGPEREHMLYRLEGRKRLTQVDLLSWAGDPRSTKVLGEGGLRCPLCDFTSFDPLESWDAGAADVVREIRADYPLWDPSQGICSQCFDLYGLRVKAEA